MRPEPSTAKGQRRRQQLLTAAQEVFERDGYFDTRVSDIVAHAHVSHGTFYVYFDSKDDILSCLIDQLVQNLFAGSARRDTAEGTPYEHLAATIQQFMNSYKANAKMMRILEQVVTFDDDFRAIRLGIITRFNERIRSAIVALQKRGVGDPDLDAIHASYVLGGMVGDCAFACYVLQQDLDEALAVATMARIWAKAVGIPVDAVKPGRRSPAVGRRRAAVR